MYSKNRHQVDLHVGQRLRKRRQELNISQEKLGEAVQLTFQQIQKYEKGYNRISSSKLYEFAIILKTSIGYFFEGLEVTFSSITNENYSFKDDIQYIVSDSASDEYEKEYNLNDEIEEMIKYFRNITSKHTRDQVLNLTKLLSEGKGISQNDIDY